MSRFSPIAIGLALPVTLLSQAALADLTPAQVWGDWRQYMQGMGYQINATEATSGNTLTVSDIQMNITVPENAGAVSMSLGTLLFSQNIDGSVSIVMPDKMPISISTTENGGGGEDFTLNMTYAQTGHSMTASGDPSKMTYVYDAATFALTLDQLIADGETFGPQNARMNLTGTGLSSSTTMTVEDLRGYEQSGSIDSVTYDIYMDNPAESAKVSMKGNVEGVGMIGGGLIPLGLTGTADMSAMIRAGFNVSGDITYAGGSTDMTVTDPVNGNFSAQTTSQGGSLGVKMGADGLAYDGSQANLDMTVTVADLPFPINISMDRGAFNLFAPVTKSDEPQKFAFGLTMANFKMSDMIWGIFDPTGQLPRDPATLELDVTGRAKLDVDYLDPTAAASMGAGGPGQVEDVQINKLLLDVAGARLEGTGDVAFDNTDFSTVPGMPKPVGQVNLSLAGGNGLLDKLVAMGLLPQDQAMGARMMMGLFAVPGGAPDTLNSKIEFTTEGAILANGQRIK